MTIETRELQNAAYAIANAIGGLIEAMGMQAENQFCADRGESYAYTQDQFYKLMYDRGLHHNALMTQIYEK